MQKNVGAIRSWRVLTHRAAETFGAQEIQWASNKHFRFRNDAFGRADGTCRVEHSVKRRWRLLYPVQRGSRWLWDYVKRHVSVSFLDRNCSTFNSFSRNIRQAFLYLVVLFSNRTPWIFFFSARLSTYPLPFRESTRFSPFFERNNVYKYCFLWKTPSFRKHVPNPMEIKVSKFQWIVFTGCVIQLFGIGVISNIVSTFLWAMWVCSKSFKNSCLNANALTPE